MQTLFSCPDLGLRIEGFDGHAFQIDERVHLRVRTRVVTGVVTAVHDSGAIREVVLRPLAPADLRGKGGVAWVGEAVPEPVVEHDGAWVEAFVTAIEGGEGPVCWNVPPPLP